MEGKLLKPISVKFASSTTAPSSPGRKSCTNPWEDFYFSEPTSPTHFLKADHLNTAISGEDLRRRAVPFDWDKHNETTHRNFHGDEEERLSTSSCADHSFEFEFSSRHSEADTDPVSAEDLFINGQIRPLNQPKSFRFEGRNPWPPRPSKLTNDRSSSSSEPKVRTSLRNFLTDETGNTNTNTNKMSAKAEDKFFQIHEGIKEGKSKDSRSYLRGLSKRWSIKDFLYRSSSDGKDRHWSFGLVPPAKQAHKHALKSNKSHEKLPVKPPDCRSASKRYDERELGAKSPQSVDGHGRRSQEVHYKKPDEDTRKKSFLPYKRSLLGCLGFPSNSYASVTRLLHPFS